LPPVSCSTKMKYDLPSVRVYIIGQIYYSAA
jgi:hypothetical protein